MEKLFGTDGIRGVANIPPMTAEIALAVGRATAYVFRSRSKRHHRIVIGKDTRLSGYMLEDALTSGIISMGVDVLLTGPMPTPGIAFTTRSMRADAGIVISASHNPYQDNGIKIFSNDGFKVSENVERQIEDLVVSGKINNIRPTADKIGKAHRIDDAIGRYIELCKRTFPDDLTLDGIKIVVDCANGATYKIAPTIFSELGADVRTIHCEPDGKNINDNCGSQFTKDLSIAVRRTRADAGLAFDGDGDRLIVIDEKGNELTGDHIIAICAAKMKMRRTLGKPMVIITPMSNIGLRIALNKMGIKYKDAEVGDRNVLEMMHKYGVTLGGEQSGHIIFRNLHTTGDGIISALQILAAIRRTGKTLSEMSKIVKVAPQKLINIEVSHKPPIESVTALRKAIARVESKLGKNGRVLIRYSGTQMLCRVMVEGPTERLTNKLAAYLANTVREVIA
ncbi:MAG: phosphoglucosamine mutase [Kiritimatiellae bacterium]|nr:phosphoglucosamine mutase [Kiritimatiellia bacterium]MDD5521292.1 phosphoglucosamine mutase [Kiritimatiellia bacterium]